jgi:pimeloyl-ACP methyl ester carboxylesterase
VAGSSASSVLPPRRELIRALTRKPRPFSAPPTPPQEPLPGRALLLPGRGEMFVRDSGGEGTPLLLLHGWVASADLNWLFSYRALSAAGYRVIAMDHRGHGRGIRSHEPFRLLDCAHDAAAAIEALGCGPALVAGYSMGGPITQLLARSHPELVRGIVLCATSSEWQGPAYARLFKRMWLLRAVLSIAGRGFWTRAIGTAGFPDTAASAWLVSELTRGDPAALAEAGRELWRFDSRPWLGELTMPSAVLLTTKDLAVAPRMQRELAERLGARTFDVLGDHMVAGLPNGPFNGVLLQALAHVTAQAR